MQKLIVDYNQFDKFVSDLKSEGLVIMQSQEEYFLPGIFFIHKYGKNKIYIEQLQSQKIYELKMALGDLWD
jgi:hypothetical protein